MKTFEYRHPYWSPDWDTAHATDEDELAISLAEMWADDVLGDELDAEIDSIAADIEVREAAQ